MIDKLIEKIEEKRNPTVVGLDTNFDYLPDDSTRMYRKEMLRIFGEKYAADYMLRR